MPLPPPDPAYTDSGISVWRELQLQLQHLPLKDFLYPEPLLLIDELANDKTGYQRREEIGLRLDQLNDPRRGVGLDDAGLPEIAWIAVPAGEVGLEVTLGGWAAPTESVRIQPFRLARYPITWIQYRAFLDAKDGYRNPRWWDTGLKPNDPPHLSEQVWAFQNYPAVGMDWTEAMAYCRWLSAKLGLYIRLPTEGEWQFAAVGNTTQKYPWKDGWRAARANSLESQIRRTQAVGMYPKGRNLLGLDDLAGNVAEWCLRDNKFGDDRNSSRAARGGSWRDPPKDLRASRRVYVTGGENYSCMCGFRIASRL